MQKENMWNEYSYLFMIVYEAFSIFNEPSGVLKQIFGKESGEMSTVKCQTTNVRSLTKVKNWTFVFGHFPLDIYLWHFTLENGQDTEARGDSGYVLFCIVDADAITLKML